MNLENIKQQIIDNYKALEAKGYDTSYWSIEEAVADVVRQYEETGNTEAEVRYDGSKFFTVDVEL